MFSQIIARFAKSFEVQTWTELVRQDQLANFQLSGAGHGIYWPDLDEDVGVEGLLLGKKSAESAESFKRWLERRALTGRS